MDFAFDTAFNTTDHLSPDEQPQLFLLKYNWMVAVHPLVISKGTLYVFALEDYADAAVSSRYSSYIADRKTIR